ncbi:MAG: twin transmembrane helix small protein [Accumulibacter sp.]|jgi:hypothetical protein|uniref:twin transmembrane helix small protein n=1 Tax=Accumulibacter sp. TaxID=2053492 RepID=UPI002FC3DD59
MKILTVLIFLAMAATVVSLALGFYSMERGGEYDRVHSTRYMVMRVAFQGLTLALLVSALYFAGV